MAFGCSIFTMGHSMNAGKFASFKDAVMGNKRDVQEEIKAAKKAAENARNETEKTIRGQIQELKNDNSIVGLDRCNAQKCYCIQLQDLFKDGTNREKYNLYTDKLAYLEQKSKLLALKASLATIKNKSEKAKTLREMSELSTKPDRIQRYMDQADALEKAEKYDEIMQMISQSTDLAQKAKLHRILVYYSEENADTNLVLAKQYEEQAEKEQQERLLIVDRTCKIVGLTMEIEKTAKDTSLTPFQRTGTLASLIESRFTLAQDVPTYKVKFADDLVRVQKLRREAIGHATNDADKQSIIKLLTY